MVESGQQRQTLPLNTNTQYLAAILDELTTIRRQLVQEPHDPTSGPQLVTEPAPPPERERRHR